MEISIWVVICMPLIAFLYASVGHGGASSYITLLTLLGYANSIIKPTALVINIVISLLAFVMYFRKVDFPWKLFLWLVVFSIPASFLGAKIDVNPILYRKVLGVLLLFPVARFLNIFPVSEVKKIDKNVLILAILGLSIGFVSGLIGIGGGIVLSPVLLMLGWTNLKETSAVSALFIFLNSISGLYSMSDKNPVFSSMDIQNNPFLIFVSLAIVGGLLGAYLGANKFQPKILKNILTVVLFIAAIKLII